MIATNEVLSGYITPPKLAERWGVSVNKILTLIKAGELLAFNCALSTRGERPRYRIREEDVLAFERARAVVPPAPAQRRKRRTGNVTEYF